MSDDRALYQQGLAQAQQQDFAGAIAYFSQALQFQPDFAEAFYQRGLAHFNLGNAQHAILDYASALQRQPENAKFYFSRGVAYLSLGNLRESLADAEQAVRFGATHAPSHSLRGTVSQRLGAVAAAIASYKQAAQLYLEQQDAANGRYCLEQIDRLKTLPDQQPERQPAPQPEPLTAEVNAFYQQALEKAQQGWYAKALEDLDWAIQIDPQDAHAYFCRAQVRREMQDWARAIADYRHAAHVFGNRADKELLKQTIAAIEQLKAVQATDRRIAEQEFGVTRQPVVQTTPLSREMQRKLLNLVAADRQTAIRLVNYLKLRNPGMPEAWYWEKAIYDLERDRWR